jgi:hypothetical protein
MSEMIGRKIAFVIDGEVVDILHTDERLAAILLSEPKLVDITDKIDTEGIGSVIVGSSYNEDSDTFFHKISEA